MAVALVAACRSASAAKTAARALAAEVAASAWACARLMAQRQRPDLGVYEVLSTRVPQLVQVLLGDRGNRESGRQHCDLVPHDRGDESPQLTPAAAVLVVAPSKDIAATF